MSNYSQFFLNSGSNIVQLDLFVLSHPNFSKVYRFVRNAIAGVTVTQENTAVRTYDYYPVQVVPSGSYNDMDQTLQLTFGDLGQLLPMELDRLTALPNHPLWGGALIGAFVDGLGNLVLPPFIVGQGGRFFVPWSAVSLQLGINDLFMFDNSGSFAVTINGGAPNTVTAFNAPWINTGGLNPDRIISPTSSSPPTVIPVTAGDSILIGVTGTIRINGSASPNNGFGNPAFPFAPVNSPGIYVPYPSLPQTTVKPQLVYRIYRSDALTFPMAGPFIFDVVNIAFTKDGATLQCQTPRLNLVATGELYTLDRFPMLRGFL